MLQILRSYKSVLLSYRQDLTKDNFLLIRLSGKYNFSVRMLEDEWLVKKEKGKGIIIFAHVQLSHKNEQTQDPCGLTNNLLYR